MTEDTEKPFRRRVGENVVAAILALIHTVPNRRERPLAGDLPGRYDFWFDGGACRVMTGWNEYTLADGVVAQVGINPTLSVTIRFPDGRRVHIQQEK